VHPKDRQSRSRYCVSHSLTDGRVLRQL
jgi:hypothetical protein